MTCAEVLCAQARGAFHSLRTRCAAFGEPAVLEPQALSKNPPGCWNSRLALLCFSGPPKGDGASLVNRVRATGRSLGAHYVRTPLLF